MNKCCRQHIYIIASVLIIILGFRLDQYASLLSGYKTVILLVRIFNFIGNGGTLLLICIAIYIAGVSLGNTRLKDTGRQGVLAVILMGIFVQILKAAIERPRIGYQETALIHLLQHPAIFDLSGRYNSFPSGHTIVSFAVAYLISYYYPTLRMPLFLTAGMVGFSRVYLGSHYPSDVIAGAFAGIYGGHLIAGGYLKKWWKEIGLFTAVGLVCFFKLGGMILFDVDEAVFSEAAREMMEIGNYITPLYNYLPRYDKPILFYWLMSLPFHLTGYSEFAARFTSATFGLFTAIITFLFVRRIYGKRAAIYATLCLALNVQYFVYTHSAVTDMTLTFFITSALYSFYMWFDHTSTSKNRIHDPLPSYFSAHPDLWLIIFWISSSFAVLTKGIIGILFPLAVAMTHLMVTRNSASIRRLLRPFHIILFLMITMPWFLIEFHINGWEFFNAFIIKHHLMRFTGVISGHKGPPYFYLLLLIPAFFPWISFLPSAIAGGWKRGGLSTFSLVWFLFILAFFSISGTKLPNYILPLFPPMAIMTGAYLSASIEKRSKGILYTLALLSLIFGLAIPVLSISGFKIDTALSINTQFILPLLFFMITLAGLYARISRSRALFATSILTIAILVTLRINVLPLVNIRLQKTLYDYSVYSRKVLSTGDILATYEINQPSILFYARRGIMKIERGSRDSLNDPANSGKRILIITDREKVKELAGITGLKTIDIDIKYAMLSIGDSFPAFKTRTLKNLP